jgi:hypothetical protein
MQLLEEHKAFNFTIFHEELSYILSYHAIADVLAVQSFASFLSGQLIADNVLEKGKD